MATDVRVSYVDFSPVFTGVNVGWAQFDPLANPIDVRVAWAQFDPLAAVEQVQVTSGPSKSQLKFIPIQDAQPYLDGVAAQGLAGVSAPHASAAADAVSVSSSTYSGGGKHATAGAVAPVFGVSGWSLGGSCDPGADSYASVSGCAAVVRTMGVSPAGMAVVWPYVDGDTVHGESGVAYPYGIRNPTDEELAMMVIQAVRKKALDTHVVYM